MLPMINPQCFVIHYVVSCNETNELMKNLNGTADITPNSNLGSKPGSGLEPAKPSQAFALSGQPHTAEAPLVFDSPHSWRSWPAGGTRSAAPDIALMSGWDAYVDELWAEALEGRAPLLAACFHRCYIDANRARNDIDTALLATPWPEPVDLSPAGQRGMGLIRRFALPGVPMYEEPLTVDDVMGRITRCYDPYHAQLAALVDAVHARFGMCVHIDCHSMKSKGNAMNEDSGAARPDMVVSDLEGQSADPFLVRWVAASLGSLSYRVQVNHPYRGGELVRRHGRPASGRHSIQIEINRALYMDEQRFVRHGGYGRLVRDLGRFIEQLCNGLTADLVPRLRAPFSSPNPQE